MAEVGAMRSDTQSEGFPYDAQEYGYWRSEEEFEAWMEEDAKREDADFYDRILCLRKGEKSDISYGTIGWHTAMRVIELMKANSYLAKLTRADDKIAIVRAARLMDTTYRNGSAAADDEIPF